MGRAEAAARATTPTVRNDPPPVQDRLPLLIGGGGEQVTLKLVARYGDANNVGGGDRARSAARKPILLRHCEMVGRDPSEIERTTGSGTVVHPRLARGGREGPGCDLRGERPAPSTGRTTRSVRRSRWPRSLLPFLEIGYRHLIAGFPNPYDEESMTRLFYEVRPLLERA